MARGRDRSGARRKASWWRCSGVGREATRALRDRGERCNAGVAAAWGGRQRMTLQYDLAVDLSGRRSAAEERARRQDPGREEHGTTQAGEQGTRGEDPTRREV